jgi:hypothetical protein
VPAWVEGTNFWGGPGGDGKVRRMREVSMGGWLAIRMTELVYKYALCKLNLATFLQILGEFEYCMHW